MPLRRRRGPYKVYFRNPQVPLPRSTAWYLRQLELGHHPHHNVDEENVQIQGDIDNYNYVPDGSSSSSKASSDESVDLQSDGSVFGTSGSDDEPYDGVSSGRSSADTDTDLDSADVSSYDEEDGLITDSDDDPLNNVPNHLIPEGDFNINADINRQRPINIHQEQRKLLYPGAQITLDESEILIKSFIVRWNLDDNAVEHLLRLLDCHMPASMLGSQHTFLKKFITGHSMKLRYFCPSCCDLLPSELEDNMECDCGHVCNLKSLKKDGRVFVQMSVSEQIQQIMSTENVVQQMRQECEESDVISGKIYKRLRETGVIGDNDISLQWNTDGVKPCKTSKVSMYPIYTCINELPYHIRKEKMMLCGLYYGKEKADFNIFLKPFLEELNQLHDVGVVCNIPGREEPVTVKVHIFLCTVDSVARAPLQGVMAHNGRHGCSFCLRRGRRMERGRGFARFYVGGHAGLPRSDDQHIEALQSLELYNSSHRKKKKHVQGVTKGSILLSLSGFSIAKSFVPDYMHLVLEGVVKTFWSHWTSSDYADEPWYLTKRKRVQLNEKLLTIKPPVEVTRAPRSIDEMTYWRAHEMKSFLLYYSLICFKGIMPLQYLRHWFLLVFSMTVYLKETMLRGEVLKAGMALQKFVNDISVLYPQCCSLYTFNTHMLLHIPKAVDNFGALWASSTFPYEHSNGVLSRFIRGSQGIPTQVCSSFLRLRHVYETGCKIFNRNDSAGIGRKLWISMLEKSHETRRTHFCGEGVRYFGGPNNYTLSLVEKASLQELLLEEVEISALSYRRLILNGTVFHAEADSGALRVRENSFAQVKDNIMVVISKILLVRIANSDQVFSVCVCELLQSIDEDLCQDTDIGISSRDIMFTCRRSERIVSILPQNIVQKCVGVPHNGDLVCLIPLPNSFERD